MIDPTHLLAVYLGGVIFSLLMGAFVTRSGLTVQWRFVLPLTLLWPIAMPLFACFPKSPRQIFRA